MIIIITNGCSTRFSSLPPTPWATMRGIISKVSSVWCFHNTQHYSDHHNPASRRIIDDFQRGGGRPGNWGVGLRVFLFHKHESFPIIIIFLLLVQRIGWSVSGQRSHCWRWGHSNPNQIKPWCHLSLTIPMNVQSLMRHGWPVPGCIWHLLFVFSRTRDGA